MIELKTYHQTQSPEIQQIWQGDQFLVTKVATIAYKILIENVGIFLYNQGAKVRNYFKKEVGTPAAGEKAPSPSTPVPIPNYAYMFSKTVQGSLLNTLLWRGALSLFNRSVPLGEKIANCGAHAKLPWLNTVKQLEIKRFPLASAAIPFTINLIDAFRKEPKNLPFTTKVAHVVKKQFSAPHFIFYASMIGLAFGNTYYGKTLGITSKDGFDASGHFMFKTVLAPIVGVALSQTAANNHPIFASTFAAAYAFSDGVFLANTATYCHTALESLAGYAWGLGIIATSTTLANTFIRLTSPRIAKTA